MQNKDGRYGSRATQADLADCYGRDCVNQLEYLAEVIDARWDFYVSLVVQSAVIAAHHGRKSLRQSRLK
jgi:hypothetical protein